MRDAVGVMYDASVADGEAMGYFNEKTCRACSSAFFFGPVVKMSDTSCYEMTGIACSLGLYGRTHEKQQSRSVLGSDP